MCPDESRVATTKEKQPICCRKAIQDNIFGDLGTVRDVYVSAATLQRFDAGLTPGERATIVHQMTAEPELDKERSSCIEARGCDGVWPSMGENHRGATAK